MQTPLFHLHQPSPPRQAERLAWLVAGGVYAAVILWVLPRVAEPHVAVVAVPLAHALSLSVVTALTAVVLWLEASRTQIRGYVVLGGTFATVAILLAAFILAFPGALLPPGPDGAPRALLGGVSTSVALFLLWHLVITICIPVSAVVLTRDEASGRPPGLTHGVRYGVLWGVLPAVAVSTWWLLVPDAVPVLLEGRTMTAPGSAVVTTTCVLAVVGLVVAVVVTRGSSVLSRWLIAICVLNLGDSLLNLGAERYSLGWYAARALGFVSLSALLIVLVVALARIDRRTDRAATTDALTGLRNRITFVDDLQREVARADRESRELALLVIDVDDFKSVNDDRGHLAGDAVLVELGERLRGEVRAGDLLVRMGGDEFVVVLVGLEGDAAGHAQVAAARIIEAMGRPITYRGDELRSSVSVGAAVYPGSATTVDGLMTRADRAMYAAKADGGGSYRLAAAPDPSTPVA